MRLRAFDGSDWWLGLLATSLLVLPSGCGSTRVRESGTSSGEGGAGDGPVASSVTRGGFLNGTGLEASHWDDGLNARSFVDWFDRELGAACRFEADAMGAQRCVPVARALVSYLDSECQKPLVTVLDLDPSKAQGSVPFTDFVEVKPPV